jgi:hypothetical protein
MLIYLRNQKDHCHAPKSPHWILLWTKWIHSIFSHTIFYDPFNIIVPSSLGLSICKITSVFLTKIAYEFVIFPVHSTSPAHFTVSDLSIFNERSNSSEYPVASVSNDRRESVWPIENKTVLQTLNLKIKYLVPKPGFKALCLSALELRTHWGLRLVSGNLATHVLRTKFLHGRCVK